MYGELILRRAREPQFLQVNGRGEVIHLRGYLIWAQIGEMLIGLKLSAESLAKRRNLNMIILPPRKTS